MLKKTKLEVLLTVSPVPLAASVHHVLTATEYSKSVSWAAAGMASKESNYIDYFPSPEIITHPIFWIMFFAPIMRSVVPERVATVMKLFFSDWARVFGAPQIEDPGAVGMELTITVEPDVKCEEELLNALAA